MYAGKYETIEAFESAHKAAGAEAMRLKSELNQATEQLQKFKAPDNYLLPADAALPESDRKLLIDLAKESGMSQEQFNKVAIKTAAMTQQFTQTQKDAQVKSEQARQEALGKYDKLELDSLSKFVQDEFGDIAHPLLDGLTNPEVFNKLKAVKQKMTNNTLPGMGGMDPSGNNNSINAIPEIKKQFGDLYSRLDTDPMNAEANKAQMIALAKRQADILEGAQAKTA